MFKQVILSNGMKLNMVTNQKGEEQYLDVNG